MFCEQCGKQVSETAKFCSNCGAPIVREQMCEEAQIEHPIDSTLSSSTNSENAIVEQPSAEKTLPVYNKEANGVTFNAFEVALETDPWQKGSAGTLAFSQAIRKLTGCGIFKAAKITEQVRTDETLKAMVTAYKSGMSVSFNTSDEPKEPIDGELRCPKCHSKHIEFDKKGFQAGKAIVGGLSRNYRAQAHNYIINKNKQNALSTFETFVNASSNEEIRNAVLLQTTKAIFSNPKSGYLKEDGSSDDSAHIIEIIKDVSKLTNR